MATNLTSGNFQKVYQFFYHLIFLLILTLTSATFLLLNDSSVSASNHNLDRLAQVDTGQQGCEDETKPETCPGTKFLNRILNIMAFVAMPLIILMIVIGGIQYSMATDNPEKVATAKGRIIKAIVALIFFVSLWSFLSWLIPGGLIG